MLVSATAGTPNTRAEYPEGAEVPKDRYDSPNMYEIDGREHLVISVAGGGGTGGVRAGQAPDNSLVGYIAFASPVAQKDAADVRK